MKTAGNLVYHHISRKVKISLKNNIGRLQKPCIVLCNHGSFYDFVYSGKIIMKERPQYIVARLYFQNKKLSWLIDKTGAFPKSLLATDVENSKNCMKVIAGGGTLAMMPEARLSTVGKFEGIQEATYKFIKKMAVPVYTIKIDGAYLANPKWGDGLRKGAKVEAELNTLLTAEDVASKEPEELKKIIEDALYYDEWEWLEKHPEVKYKHKTIAEGLENILCKCPKCGAFHSLKTEKNQITCEKCDLSVTLDDRYQLSGVNFKNIAEWYEWQTAELLSEIKKDKNYALESEVELRHLGTDGKSFTKHAGFGVCKLDRTGLLYKGTDGDKEVEKFFPIDSIYRLLFGSGEDFEIYDGQEIYYFVPKDKRSCIDWYIVSGLLKEKL
jgi:1-acyl-sn-glycerol-3-phosphate acyltransferase